MNKRAYNVPQYYHSVWYRKATLGRSMSFVRSKQFKVSLPIIILLPYIYAYHVTNTRDIADEDYERNFKVILPEDI